MNARLRQRFGFSALVFAIQSLYMPLNHGLQEGTIFNSSWDAYIPLWPVWIVPYALCWPLWLAGYAWAALRMEEKLYRALIVASVLATSIAIATFFSIRHMLFGRLWWEMIGQVCG